MQSNHKHTNRKADVNSRKKGSERKPTRSASSYLIGTSRDITPYIGLGLQLAVSIVVFLFFGRLVDSWLGTDPVFMVIGAFIGCAGGMISVIRTVLKHDEIKKRKKQPHED
jgi:F0F1-type ATP synthase assembly protein I